MLNLFNRIIDKWLRFYRAKSFEAYTGKKAKNLSILGKVYLRNKNVIVGENVTLYPGVMFQGEGEIYIGNNTFWGIIQLCIRKRVIKYQLAQTV